MGDSAGVSAAPVHSSTAAAEPFVPVPAALAKSTHVDADQYEAMYARSLADPAGFWGDLASEHLSWFKAFDAPLAGDFASGDASWFLHGELNASVNCLDRHVAAGRGDAAALIWDADEPGTGRTYTFNEVLAETCRVANVLKSWGVRRGDTIALYMPMIPETVFSMLACARLGAIHNVVFAGFSPDALRARIEDAKCKWVLTSDRGQRGGRTLLLKKTVDVAVEGVDCVRNVFVFERRTPGQDSAAPTVDMTPGRDVWMSDELPKHRGFCPAERMDAEDLLFILYTSGSTGSPKGVAHSTAGYLLYALLTTKMSFDVHPGDVFGCVADVGWITGHSYIVYGPLLNGATTVLFESTPTYPHAGRYWELIQTHKLTQFYTAPTAIRALMAHDHDHSHADAPRPHAAEHYDLSTLRVLGSVGEPINREAWKWYYNTVGRGNCYVADTYWQTETGGHIGVGLPGAVAMKPGACAKPFFGIDFVLTDEHGNEKTGNDVEGHLCIRQAWPGMARTVYGDHARFVSTYFPEAYRGLYFTGDGARRDADGFYFITGRVNDVLCTSGHRIGTAELEQALTAHEDAAEAAVIGIPHRIKGEGICCFVLLADGAEHTAELEKQLVVNVRSQIGAFATPDVLVVVPDLPKTRSGKIMRRVLRKIAHGEEDQLGDLSTLAEPAVVPAIIAAMKTAMVGKKI